MMTLFPIISAAYASDPARVERLLRTAVDYLAMASLPALAFTLVAAEPIVKLLFGDEFLPAADALRILMAAFVPVCLVFLTGNMLIVLKRQNALITRALIALAANVALNLTFLPTYGYIAAAWATLVTELLIAALTARVVTREIGTRIWSGRLLKTIGAAAAMGVVVAVLRDAGVLLAGLVAAALVVYPALLFLVGAIDGEELRGLIRRTPAE
jgi:O-antigen/teichoic acid export membrane protein